MNQREKVLWRIAELYNELSDPLNGPASLRGDGESLTLMPRTYTATVREYERLVKAMREDRSAPLLRLEDGTKVSVRSAWWHLNEYWHKAQRRIKHVPVTKAGKKGRLAQLRNADGSPVTKPTIEWLRDAAADKRRAELAIQHIASKWSLVTEPMLPSEVAEGLQAAA